MFFHSMWKSDINMVCIFSKFLNTAMKISWGSRRGRVDHGVVKVCSLKCLKREREYCNKCVLAVGCPQKKFEKSSLNDVLDNALTNYNKQLYDI